MSITAAEVEEAAKVAEPILHNFWVKFFNPITKLKHSSWAVAAPNPVAAVQQAVNRAQTEMAGTELAHIATYDTAITDEHGNPVEGVSKVMSTAQIQAQIAELQKQLGLLNDQGETPAQSDAVTGTLGSIPRAPQAPARPLGGPVFVPPPATSEPVSQVVSAESAPRPNGGQFTQSQVDEMIAEAKRQGAGG